MKTPNWTKAIFRAYKDKTFTVDDRIKADAWTTCACGKQDSRIPVNARGEPVDDTLFALGERFSLAVKDDNPSLAEFNLNAIEKRAAEVLAEVLEEAEAK